jgi:polyferredoxin
MQAVLLIISGFIIFDGLFGPQQAPKNLATVTAWVHYRGFIVLALLMVGNLFCMACPFMLPRELGRWLGARLGWQGKVPRALRHKWLAVTLLIVFFFTMNCDFDQPWLTQLIVGYFLTALVVDTFFKGRLCKYVSVLGAIQLSSSLTLPNQNP